MQLTQYEKYMASSVWARKRQARLALDGHRCRMCDEDGTRYQLEVHHRPSSYRRIPNESVQDDLVTVCARCHEQITTAIRSDRYGQRTLPVVEVITENINVRMEIDYGVARNSLQVSILSPTDPAQRQDRQPPRPMDQGDQTDFVQRAKTDADYEEMARLEFLAGLYMGPSGPVVPSYMMDAVLVAGAKKSKEGQLAKSGVFCMEHASLEYDGPRTVEGLWADERFRFSAIVRVQNARVARMRPRFDTWQAIVRFKYEPTTVNASRIDDWLETAGSQIGLGDWRPQNGRFQVIRL